MILTLALSAAALGADEAMPQKSLKGQLKLTLAGAIRMSLDSSLRMTEAQLSVLDSEYQRQATYSDFFPNLEILYTANFDRYMDPNKVALFARSQNSRHASIPMITEGFLFPTITYSTYPYRIDPFRTFTLTATLTQPLFVGGKTLSEYKNAQLQVESDRAQVSVTRQDVILDVTTAYYNVIRYQKLLEVNGESLASLKKIRRRAWDFFLSKVFSKADYLATDTQIYEARRSRNTLNTSLVDSREQLNYLLRIPFGTAVKVQDDSAYRPAPYNLDNIFTIAARNRAELVRAGIATEQARALAKSARADLLPSAYVQVRGSRINDDWNVADPEGINTWAIEGILRWRFDTFRLRGTVKSKDTETAKAQTSNLRLAEEIMRSVLKAYRALKRAEQDIQLNREAVKSNRERFRVVLERYDSQMADYTEALNAQSALYQSLSLYNDSVIEYRVNLANLEREMGVLGSQGP